MKSWQRTEPTETIKIGWRNIVTKHFVLPDGQTGEFQLYGKEDTHHAGVVALTPDNKVLVACQFRPGPEKIMYEIPGGGVEAGEDYMAAATRELEEETGFRPARMEPLGDVYKDAYSNSTWHYYLATGCQPVAQQNLDDGEFVDVEQISISDFIANAKNGRMTDTEAVFLAYDFLKEVENGKNN